MKNIFPLLLLTITLFACKQSKLEKILIPRALQNGESFDEFPKSNVQIFTISKVDSSENELTDNYQILFRDTVLKINKDPKPLAIKFLKPKFLNSQKTAVVAQVADKSGLVSPFYIFSFKNGKLEAIELNKSSNGKKDIKVTKGLEELSRSSMIIDNDYLITTINGKVYPIKRQNEAERIQGKIFMVSRDASTLIFLTDNSFYQYNYLTGESFNLPIKPNLVKDETNLYALVQRNYSWFKNDKGSLFLKDNPDDDRIVDIKEFKN